MTDYRGWQLDPKGDLSQGVRDALDNYIKRNGLPTEILLETGRTGEIPLPDGMTVVVRCVSLPSNVLLIGSMD